MYSEVGREKGKAGTKASLPTLGDICRRVGDWGQPTQAASKSKASATSNMQAINTTAKQASKQAHAKQAANK